MAELLICFLLLSVLAYGLFQGVNIYEAFTEGAAQGLKQALGLIPYLLAIMVPIQLWQSAGLTEALTGLLEPLLRLRIYPTYLWQYTGMEHGMRS